MASHCGRNKEPSKFVPTRPRFFKIIHQLNIADGKLVLPRRFVQNHGNNLETPLLLKASSGPVWKVELKKCNDEVCMQQGWREFAEYYSLDHGHLLVFEYKGNSCFYVFIFDQTATEKEYPLVCRHGEEPNMEETKDGDSREILNNSSTGRKRREKPSLTCTQPRKVSRVMKSKVAPKPPSRKPPNGAKCGGPNLEIAQKSLNSHGSITRAQGESRQPARNKSCSELVVQEPLCSSVHRAASYPSFKVSLQYYHLKKSTMNVPMHIVKEFDQNHGQAAILQAADNRSWKVNMLSYYFPRRVKFSGGWNAFTEGNSLQIGDVCTFELFDCRKPLFKVSISRNMC